MQTNFTAQQLRDPATAASAAVLKTCVHCGMCTATCPTFVLLGDELDSPRGRIYLMKDMLEAGRPATAEVVRHVDRCLSCLACMTTCPSGVHYMHLVDHARAYIEATYRRPWHDRWLRAVLGWVLPHPGRFRLALAAARLARPIAPLLAGRGTLPTRLAAMLTMAPRRLPPAAAPEGSPRQLTPAAAPEGVHPAEGRRRFRVALLAGCAQRVLDPGINAATIRLLNRLGGEVVVADGAGCCGALVHHLGQHDAAMAAARADIAAWMRERHGAGLDGIIINAAGCGTMVKDYGFMFRNEAEADAAAEVSGLAMDVSEALERFGYAPSRPPPGLAVGYQAACSLQHGQSITTTPQTLLRKAGFRVVEPAEAHLCCGSAGSYNLLQPEIAGRLRERKLERLRAVGPDVVATGNIGCLTQLADGGLPIVHIVELLDWMAGGPAPEKLPAARLPAA